MIKNHLDLLTYHCFSSELKTVKWSLLLFTVILVELKINKIEKLTKSLQTTSALKMNSQEKTIGFTWILSTFKFVITNYQLFNKFASIYFLPSSNVSFSAAVAFLTLSVFAPFGRKFQTFFQCYIEYFSVVKFFSTNIRLFSFLSPPFFHSNFIKIRH